MRQHALSTIITALSISLAGGLLMSVWVVKTQSRATFTGVNGGFDAVLGARGSKLQLVLNAIFHLEASPGNLAWEDYMDIKSNRFVELAIPLAVGDNYKGYRLVGTLPELFEKVEYAPGKHYQLAEGDSFFDAGRRAAGWAAAAAGDGTGAATSCRAAPGRRPAPPLRPNPLPGCPASSSPSRRSPGKYRPPARYRRMWPSSVLCQSLAPRSGRLSARRTRRRCSSTRRSRRRRTSRLTCGWTPRRRLCRWSAPRG